MNKQPAPKKTSSVQAKQTIVQEISNEELNALYHLLTSEFADEFANSHLNGRLDFTKEDFMASLDENDRKINTQPQKMVRKVTQLNKPEEKLVKVSQEIKKPNNDPAYWEYVKKVVHSAGKVIDAVKPYLAPGPKGEPAYCRYGGTYLGLTSCKSNGKGTSEKK